MNRREALELIAGAVPSGPGVWADLGAGDGTFTRALAERLGPGSRIYAVDREAAAIATLGSRAVGGTATVIPVRADFTGPFDLPGLERGTLDGMLLANALHFVRNPGIVLARLAEWLRPRGRVVWIEYDRRHANRWVPYPIPTARLPALAESAGLSAPVVTATRPSAYGGDLYVAKAERLR